MSQQGKLRRLLLPSFTPKAVLRILLVALSAYVFFGHICIPIRIRGASMEPTYRTGGFNSCWRLRYAFSEPARHDVVFIRFAGKKVMLLKRVVALEGETVEFRQGNLFVNGTKIDEPYIRYPCNWNLPPRQVKKDRVYVVGDNRSMPIQCHNFGQMPRKRIVGTPLW